MINYMIKNEDRKRFLTYLMNKENKRSENLEQMGNEMNFCFVLLILAQSWQN